MSADRCERRSVRRSRSTPRRAPFAKRSRVSLTAAWSRFATTDTGCRRSEKTRAARTPSSSSSSNRLTRRGSWARWTKPCPAGRRRSRIRSQQAAQDFGAPSDEERALILVSDGIETCGGDPLATVRDLAAKGFKVKVHTIGFNVDAAARAQLEAISSATGGEVLRRAQCVGIGRDLAANSRSAPCSSRATRPSARRSAAAPSMRRRSRSKRRTTYHLDHHQREDEYDYFAVDARDGQKIVASIQAFEKAVTSAATRSTRPRRHTPALPSMHPTIGTSWIGGSPTRERRRPSPCRSEMARADAFTFSLATTWRPASEQPLRCHGRRFVRCQQWSRRGLGGQQGGGHPAGQLHRVSPRERLHGLLRLHRVPAGEVQPPRQARRAGEGDRPRGIGSRRSQGERGRRAERRRGGARSRISSSLTRARRILRWPPAGTAPKRPRAPMRSSSRASVATPPPAQRPQRPLPRRNGAGRRADLGAPCGLPTLWIGLGVLAVAALVAGAYMLGRRGDSVRR